MLAGLYSARRRSTTAIHEPHRREAVHIDVVAVDFGIFFQIGGFSDHPHACETLNFVCVQVVQKSRVTRGSIDVLFVPGSQHWDGGRYDVWGGGVEPARLQASVAGGSAHAGCVPLQEWWD